MTAPAFTAAPESVACDCLALVEVKRWAEHRATCPAAWWRKAPEPYRCRPIHYYP